MNGRRMSILRKKEKKTLKSKFLKFLYYHDNEICCFGWIVAIIAAIVSLIMIVSIIDINTSVNGTIAQMDETYKALCFKAESDFARDELGLLNKEIVDEIQSWNETIVYKQKMQDNFWVGIFYPDIYDDFENIVFSKLNEKLNNTKTFTD